MRRLAFLLCYCVTTVGLGIALSECAVRLLALAPPAPTQYSLYVDDPWLPFMLRPNAVLTGRSESGEFDFHYEHNSIGFRDGEHPVKKPDGTFRILGLGDSFTYGIGAAFDQTYLARLEHLLNSRGPGHPPVEVIKAGIPRFFPEAERLLLDRHGLRFGPDLILVAFEPNDVGDTYLGLDALVVGPDGQLVTRGVKGLSLQGERSLALLYRHSHLVRALLQRLATYRAQRPIRWPEVWQDNGLHEADWLEVERQFILMRSAIEGARLEMVLVHIPQKVPSRVDATTVTAWTKRRGFGWTASTIPPEGCAPGQRGTASGSSMCCPPSELRPGRRQSTG